MKKTALFLFMLFAFVMKAQEIPETFYIGEDQIIKTKYYIYPKTVRESERPGYITAWFLVEFSTPQKRLNNKYYMKTKDQVLINCKYKKMGLITSVAYTKNDVHVESAKVIDEYLVEEEAAPPSSVGEGLIKVACTFYDKMSNQNQE